MDRDSLVSSLIVTYFITREKADSTSDRFGKLLMDTSKYFIQHSIEIVVFLEYYWRNKLN